jgi:hypothetical protein
MNHGRAAPHIFASVHEPSRVHSTQRHEACAMTSAKEPHCGAAASRRPCVCARRREKLRRRDRRRDRRPPPPPPPPVYRIPNGYSFGYPPKSAPDQTGTGAASATPLTFEHTVAGLTSDFFFQNGNYSVTVSSTYGSTYRATASVRASVRARRVWRRFQIFLQTLGIFRYFRYTVNFPDNFSRHVNMTLPAEMNVCFCWLVMLSLMCR